VTVLWIAVAGAGGGLAQYGLSGLVHTIAGTRLPWGTLLVNLLGCFFLGLITEISGRSGWLLPEAIMGMTIGFLRSFTTFSTFGVEKFPAIESADWVGAVSNVLLNLVGGLAFALIGVLTAIWFLHLRGAL
jgi:CrcB protein